MDNDWDQKQAAVAPPPASAEQHTAAWPHNAYQQQQQQQVDQNYQQQWYAYYAAQNQQQQAAVQHQVTDTSNQPTAATSVAPPLPAAPPPAQPPPPVGAPLVWNGSSYVQAPQAQAAGQPVPQTTQATDAAAQASTPYAYGTTEQYAYGSSSYQNYGYAYAQQGNESYPGPYASAAPYQPTSYQSPTTYYSNNGVYQPPGAYQSTGYSATWTDSSSSSNNNYASYGNYPAYTYSSTDAGSSYYGQQQSASEPTAPPGMEAPTSTYASVVAHGSSYPAPPKQPPPPGTQPTWAPPQSTSGTTSNGHISWQVQQSSQQQQGVQNVYNHKSPVKIPMNPRIPQTIPYQRPAYIAVAAKPAGKTDASESKPVTFPPSLRAYVERALARCKNEAQKTVCQRIMKETITRASSDGTLFTKNWDIEPLFPLPSLPSDEKDQVANTDRRKTKSRWEPVESTTVQPAVNKNNVLNQQPKQTTPVVTMNWVKRDGPWIKPKPFQPPSFQPVAAQQQQHQQQQQQVLQQQTQQPPPPPQQLQIFQQQQQQPHQQQFQAKQKQKQEAFSFSRKNAKRQRKANAKPESDGSSESEETDYNGVLLGSLGTSSNPEENKRRQTRTKRFESCKNNAGAASKKGKAGLGLNTSTRRATAMRLAMSSAESQAVEDIDWDSLTIKGTSQEIEKRYLRLTSAPDPATVRPEEVLVKALEMVTSTSKSYYYKCEQLKSIRQDLTVQRIRNKFTVQVYETHARTALEAGDLAEYNQCQTQLKGLYGEGINGCCNEFAAYSLLYAVFQNGSNRDLLSSMARLSAEARQDESVKHALAVRAAVSLGNYIQYFRLYKTAPNLSSFLMDLHVEKMRFEALRCMSRSYRPTLALEVIARNLGFVSTDPSNELDECEEWVKCHGGQIVTDSNTQERQFDTKTSSTTLFMPEPEDAVSHGDSNLAVNDFLARSVPG